MLEVRQREERSRLAPDQWTPTSAATRASGDASWMLRGDDIAATVLDLLRGRDEAPLSRRWSAPLRPRRA
jgi:hypothetical protein